MKGDFMEILYESNKYMLVFGVIDREYAVYQKDEKNRWVLCTEVEDEFDGYNFIRELGDDV